MFYEIGKSETKVAKTRPIEIIPVNVPYVIEASILMLLLQRIL